MTTRKIYVDLGVRIHINVERIQPGAAEGGDTALAFALGKIEYPEGFEGELLYVKPRTSA